MSDALNRDVSTHGYRVISNVGKGEEELAFHTLQSARDWALWQSQRIYPLIDHQGVRGVSTAVIWNIQAEPAVLIERYVEGGIVELSLKPDWT